MSFKQYQPWDYSRAGEVGLTKADLKRQRRLTSKKEVEDTLAEEEEILETMFEDDDE